MLVLDEPTSALDAETERIVARNLRENLRNSTVIVITHRPALAEIADQVINLREGKVWLESLVRIAVIDSGVNPAHPHIARVDGGWPENDFLDRLGHGTAVMAAIQEKAPDAEYFAARMFDRELRTNIDTLLAAIQWSHRSSDGYHQPEPRHIEACREIRAVYLARNFHFARPARTPATCPASSVSRWIRPCLAINIELKARLSTLQAIRVPCPACRRNGTSTE